MNWAVVKRIGGLGGASIINIALISGLSLLLAKVLTVEEFGITRTIAAYIIFLSMFGNFTFHNALAANLARSDSAANKANLYTTATYTVAGMSSIVALTSGLFFWYSELWVGSIKLPLLLVTLSLPLTCLTLLYNASLEATGSYRSFAIVQTLAGLVPFIVILVLAVPYHLNGWVGGRLLATLILLILSAYVVKPFLLTGHFSTNLLYDLWRFARIQIFSGALSLVLLSADIILLERISGDINQVAQYGMALLFAKAALFVPTVLGRSFFRDIARADNAVSVRNFLAIVAASAIGVSGALWLVGPWIIQSLYGETYTDASDILRVLCYGLFFSFLWHAISVVNIALKTPEFAVIISVSGSLFGLVSLATLIPSYGAIGAAWSMNIANAAGVFVGLALLARYLVKTRAAPFNNSDGQ